MEPRVAIGGFLLAAAMLIVALGAAASIEGAVLAALVALALGAAAAFDAWRRLARRCADAEAALAATRDDLTRGAAWRAAAESKIDDLRETAAQHDAREQHVRAATARQLQAVREQADEQVERQRAEHERLEHARARAEQALGQQRELTQRLMRSRRAEREWNRELRAQVQRLYDAPRTGPRGEHSDVRELVLHTAIELVEAPKGMLLSREDADGDGALDVVVSHGFEHDPAHSEVAQRFAREVLRSDEIVRQDEPAHDSSTASDADKEIDALVAIPLYLRDRFHGVIIGVNRPGGFDEVDDDVLLALGDQAGAALHHGQLQHELNDAHHAAIRTLLEATASRDPRLHQESRGLTLHTLALARDLELEPRKRDVLVYAMLLRHVGYLATPDHLLSQARPLRADERAVIELHSRIAFNIIGQTPALRDVATAVLYHHERIDGAGYPAGLAGDAIPQTARALSVLEAYAAMTHDRPYRARLSPEEACEQLIAAAGTQFDPEIAQLLVEEIRSGPPAVDDRLTDAVIEALPLNLAGQAGAGMGPLPTARTDGLTLLANQRALYHDIRDATAGDGGAHPFAVVLIQLEDLPHINEHVGYAAGDHLIQVAARNAQRTAARFGGTAYRASGRRLALLAPLTGANASGDVVNHLMTEFAGGSSVRTATAIWRPGDPAADVLGRARASLTCREP
ncbi:MAG TPA: HD domain-containing phosphohydrolase [Solirubrobacteraceae bacterium]|nr:HD domain-containing phosphohydrolase [Solirubrobacteraceae bacterium]